MQTICIPFYFFLKNLKGKFFLSQNIIFQVYMSGGYKHLTRIRRGLTCKGDILSCSLSCSLKKLKFSFQDKIFGVLYM